MSKRKQISKCTDVVEPKKSKTNYIGWKFALAHHLKADSSTKLFEDEDTVIIKDEYPKVSIVWEFAAYLEFIDFIDTIVGTISLVGVK